MREGLGGPNSRKVFSFNLGILRFFWYQTIPFHAMIRNLIIFNLKNEVLTEFEHIRERGPVWGGFLLLRILRGRSLGHFEIFRIFLN